MTRRSPSATERDGAGERLTEEAGQPPLAIVIETARDERVSEGQRLADVLDVPILDSADLSRGSVAADVLLVVGRDALEIAMHQHQTGRRARPSRGALVYREKGVAVDLGGLDGRIGPGGLSRKQPIARAIGREARLVVDGTGGFGQDGRLLAAMGYDVLATERSPILHALLADGLRRASESSEQRALLGDRLHLWPEPADVRDVLEARGASGEPVPDVVYLDPMFPPRRKESALARKSVRMIRQVVGADPDASSVLRAVRSKVRRVVVKRPPDAAPVADDPAHTIETKLARYDVYLDPTRPTSMASPGAANGTPTDSDDAP